MSVVVVIPARGGSKGIPGKNLRPVDGVPLVARAVEAARAAQSVDRVYVTTDDPGVARVAREAGADVIERSESLSGDEASSESALLHALEKIAETGVVPDVTVMMQCTSPFTIPEDVDGTVALVLGGGADCAFTASRTHGFLWRASASGATAVNHDATGRPRRQDRAPEYVESGAVYAMRTDGFHDAQHRFFGRIEIFEVPPERAIEIDEPGDLARAERYGSAAFASAASPSLPIPVSAIAFDFDGVLTDNRVVTFQDGTEAVVADRSDGLGIEMLRAAGLSLVVLSKERNPVVAVRCAKLGLECRQGIDDKVAALRAWVAERGLDLTRLAFVGNDVNDVACLEAAGLAVVPADAHPAARAAADLVLTHPGGRGAVRELADLILTPAREEA